MSDPVRLPDRAAGDRQSVANLLPVVYDELRKLAGAKMASERADHTLDATALVHEVWLRLGGQQSFESKSHFLRAAAEAMRRILVDHARAKHADKRGGGQLHLSIKPDVLIAPGLDSDVVAIDEALSRLAEIDPQAAELVSLRFFGGLTQAAAADALGLSTRTADRLWTYAKAFLYTEISKGIVA